MAESPTPDNLHYRIRREAGGVLSWLAGLPRLAVGLVDRVSERVPAMQGGWLATKNMWRERFWFRWLGYAVLAMLVLWFLIWVFVARNLPSAEKLIDYQPPLPTMVRGVDGEIAYSYARERRVQLRYVDFPEKLKNAFLSAEDKTFWTHGGVDFTGLAGAVIDYATKVGSDERARGGSTITQQVAKNIFLGDEYSITRKLKEMILARRIEGTLQKEQILELYLNEIPLGRQAFGVQAASRAYFGKDIGDLTLAQTAFLAILPKAPEKYGRAQNEQAALTRRNWVLGQMVKNGWATEAEAAAAKAEPLGLIPRRAEAYDPSVGYFVEEVRRQLIEKYGEKAESGPNSVYAGGLWVRTSLDGQMQKAAVDALRAGLMRYGGGRGWSGPIVKVDPASWQSGLVVANKSISYKNWRVGAVVKRSGASATIGFADGQVAPLTGLPDALRAGDVIAAEPVGNAYAVRTIPEVSGGLLVENPFSGRVEAMAGGFDSGLDSFNRATQAKRQPGSTIKPFVYATGLEHGMTPSTMVLDGEFCVWQGSKYGKKCFKNFGGAGGTGNHTMRWGLEQSRNLMTVRIANDAGMPNVSKTLEQVGIGKYEPYLAFALGAGETTVQNMVNAYSALANGGVQYASSLIDYVQDRNGKVIWRADDRRCTGCNMANWDGKPMPRLTPRGRQVMDAGTAFQVVNMLQGVVQRGTATVLKDLDLPMFGKTGTTNGPTNVWFVGGVTNHIAGVYLGYDKPRSLGGWAQGGSVAAPIVKSLIQSTKPRWNNLPFSAPNGIRLVKVDRITGKRVFGGDVSEDPKASVIWEAFKADTEPRRSTRVDEFIAKRDALVASLRRGPSQPKAASHKASAEDEVVTDESAPAEQAPPLPTDIAKKEGGVY